jgi:undecaprenyl-diphosphatase
MKPAARHPDRDRLLNILFILALLIFIVIAVCVSVYPENNFDRYIQEETHPLASPALLPFWIRMTFFGSFEFLFPAYVIFILMNVWRRNVRFGLSIAVLAIGGFLSVQVLKLIFQRHRPSTPLLPELIDYSFPSGHSTASFIFCAVMICLLRQTTAAASLRFAGISLLFLLTLFVGLSRIVLAVHYPTDVTAGFCLGTIWSIGWYRFVQNKK